MINEALSLKRLKWILKLFLFCTLGACSTSIVQRNTAAEEDTACFGPVAARHFVVYLHGQDTVTPSALEINNRKILARLADVLSIRVALPRATMTCPNKPALLCWGWKFDEQVAKKALLEIQTAAQKCFPQARAMGMIGFSSGGYLANQVFQHQLSKQVLPPISWIISVGSTFGSWNENESRPYSPGGIPLVFLIGTQDDFNRDPKNAYFNYLHSRGGNVTLTLFDGGHQLPDEELLSTVRANLSREGSDP